jgi:hypothetical protein
MATPYKILSKNMQEQKGKYEGLQNDELGIKIRSNDNP